MLACTLNDKEWVTGGKAIEGWGCRAVAWGAPLSLHPPAALLWWRVGPGFQDSERVSYGTVEKSEHPESVRDSSEGACIHQLRVCVSVVNGRLKHRLVRGNAAPSRVPPIPTLASRFDTRGATRSGNCYKPSEGFDGFGQTVVIILVR